MVSFSNLRESFFDILGVRGVGPRCARPPGPPKSGTGLLAKKTLGGKSFFRRKAFFVKTSFLRQFIFSAKYLILFPPYAKTSRPDQQCAGRCQGQEPFATFSILFFPLSHAPGCCGGNRQGRDTKICILLKYQSFPSRLIPPFPTGN